MSYTRNTSIEAYKEIKEKGLLSNLRWDVYNFLYENGPSTAKQIHMALKREGSNDGCYTTRLSELRRMGVVKELGTVKCEYTGRKVILWDLIDALPQKIKIEKTARMQLAEALALVSRSKPQRESQMNEPRYGYMCKVDFDWELGEALGGTTIYPSIDDLKSKRPCVFTCGIVKVKVELEEVVDAGERWGEDDNAEKK